MIRKQAVGIPGTNLITDTNTSATSNSFDASRVSRFMHGRFIWLLLASYVVAGVVPACGLWLKSQSLGELHFLSENIRLSLPMLMLSFLLFNAGLGVDWARLKESAKRPWPLLLGWWRTWWFRSCSSFLSRK